MPGADADSPEARPRLRGLLAPSGLAPAEPCRQGRARAWGLVALWLSLGALAVWAFHGVRQDDAFITFRFAQNLARGLGPTFNPGVRVLGTTSPGEMVLAAALYRVVGHDHLPTAMSAIGAASVVAQGAAIHALLRRSQGEATALVAGLALALGLGAAWSFVGLETNVTVAWVLLAFALADRARWQLAAVSAAVAVVFRADAGLMLVWLVVPAVRALGRAAARPVSTFLALSAPWPVFATAYFGSPLPSTTFKAFRTELRAYLGHQIEHLTSTLAPGLAGTALAWLVWPLVVLGGLALWRGTSRVAAWLPIAGLAHVAAYAVLRPFHRHTWHLAPEAVIAGVCLVVALGRLARARLRPARLAGLALLAALLAGTGWRSARAALDHPRARYLGARHEVYEAAAAFLRRRGDPAREAFASVEVGTIAYLSDFPADDLAFLVTTTLETVPQVPRRWVFFYPWHDPALAPRAACSFSARRGEFAVRIHDMTRPLPATTDACDESLGEVP